MLCGRWFQILRPSFTSLSAEQVVYSFFFFSSPQRSIGYSMLGAVSSTGDCTQVWLMWLLLLKDSGWGGSTYIEKQN